MQVSAILTKYSSSLNYILSSVYKFLLKKRLCHLSSELKLSRKQHVSMRVREQSPHRHTSTAVALYLRTRLYLRTYILFKGLFKRTNRGTVFAPNLLCVIVFSLLAQAHCVLIQAVESLPLECQTSSCSRYGSSQWFPEPPNPATKRLLK